MNYKIIRKLIDIIQKDNQSELDGFYYELSGLYKIKKGTNHSICEPTSYFMSKWTWWNEKRDHIIWKNILNN